MDYHFLFRHRLATELIVTQKLTKSFLVEKIHEHPNGLKTETKSDILFIIFRPKKIEQKNVQLSSWSFSLEACIIHI